MSVKHTVARVWMLLCATLCVLAGVLLVTQDSFWLGISLFGAAMSFVSLSIKPEFLFIRPGQPISFKEKNPLFPLFLFGGFALALLSAVLRFVQET